MKILVNDEVLVTGGKDKGRRGKVEKVLPKESLIVIPGINIYKKHVKGAGKEKGGIYEIARPLPVSKVAIICPSCKKQTRVGYRVDKNGQKTRICVKCKEAFEIKA